MLVLARKAGQRIKIGDDVWVMVTEIGSNQVKLGFEAPRGIKIRREEIYERVLNEDRQLERSA